MKTIDHSPAANPDSESLGLLLDGLAERIQAGEPVDLEAAVRDHPEHAASLRQLLPALQLLADVAPSAPGRPTDGVGDTPGRLGDFLILRELGRGGMGVVYEAEQISLGRRVALKVLPFAATMDARQLQRFKNEARAAASLHHEHIVPVHAVGSERGVHYYAMQLIEGQSLAAMIDELRQGGSSRSNGSHGASDASGATGASGHRAPTAPVAAQTTRKAGPDKAHYRRVAELIAQAADAVEFAHSTGVVHRDIKPANLLLDAAGHLWVTDFGLAKLDTAVSMTVSGDLLGTLRYMSPEQALARHGLVDHRTDVYSLGATLYELLTLKPAVDGADKHEVLRCIAFEEPTPPRKLDKAIPSELETVTLKALAKSPGDRYATAGELRDDLRRWLGNQTIKAKPPSLVQRAMKWSLRHRSFVGAALAVLGVATVALAASLGLMWAKERETQAARTRAERNLSNSLAVLDRVVLQVAEKRYPEQAKVEPADQNLLREVLEFYEQFARDNDGDPATRYELAKAYLRVGELRKKLGHLDWRVSVERCQRLLNEIIPANPDRPEYLASLAKCLAMNGTYDEAAKIWDALSDAFPKQFEYRRGQVFVRTRYSGGPHLQTNVVDLAERLARDFPGEPVARLHLGEALNLRGTDDWLNARFDQAWRKYQASQAVFEKLAADFGDDPDFLDSFGRNCRDVGETLTLHFRKYQEAEPYLVRAVQIDDSLAARYPNAPSYRVELAKSLTTLANLYEFSQQPSRLKETAVKGVRVLESVTTLEFIDKMKGQFFAFHVIFAQMLASLGEWPEARRSLEHMTELVGGASDGRLSDSVVLASAYFDLGWLWKCEGNQPEADRSYGQGGLLLARIVARANDNRLDSAGVNDAAWLLATCPELKYRDAEQAVRLAERAATAEPRNRVFQNTFGVACYRAGKWDDAIRALKRSMELAGSGSPFDYSFVDSLFLAMAHQRRGEGDKAAKYYAEALEVTGVRQSDWEIRRFRAEAAQLLGVPDTPKAPAAKPPDP